MALMMFERGAPRDPLEAALFGDFFGDGPGAFGLLPFAGRREGPPGRKRGPCGPAARRRLALDVAEHEGSYEISADLPGVKREDVQLEVGHDGVLKLSVSQAAEKKVRFEGEEGNPPPPDEGRAEEPREGEAGPEEEGAVRGRGGEPSATRRGAGRGAAGGRGGPRGAAAAAGHQVA